MSLSQQKVSFADKVATAWGSPPDWIAALAEECDRSTQSAVARRLGVSAGLVSGVLSGTYGRKGGDMQRIEEKVRGALMGVQVVCPVLGELTRDRCLDEQEQPFRATSKMRAQLYHACRQGCPHYRRK